LQKDDLSQRSIRAGRNPTPFCNSLQLTAENNIHITFSQSSFKIRKEKNRAQFKFKRQPKRANEKPPQTHKKYKSTSSEDSCSPRLKHLLLASCTACVVKAHDGLISLAFPWGSLCLKSHGFTRFLNTPSNPLASNSKDASCQSLCHVVYAILSFSFESRPHSTTGVGEMFFLNNKASSS
jgi:hypothetical protein